MADSQISQLPAAVSVTNADVVPVDQGNVTKRATLGQVAGLMVGQIGAFPPAIDYPMGGHKFTGLGVGSASGDSVPYQQVGAVSRLDEPKFAGFMNIADFTLAWSNTTRTLTVSPVTTQFQFYANGILYTKTTIESISIPNTTGNYYFYYDANGVLSVGTSFNNNFILVYSFLASVYWNAATSLTVPDAIFERHQAAMPALDHLYLHSTVGTAYDSYVGGLLPAVTADGDGSLDAHIEFSATPGAIWDDDVQEIISVKQLLDNIPILYRTGASGVWTFDESSPTMVRTTGTGRAAYNQFTGGAWQLTEVTDTQFMLMHLYAIPGFSKKWMMIMGQAQYATLTLASNAALTEITAIAAIPLSENKAIASFVIQTNNAYANSVKSRVRVLDSGADFIDWRFAQVGGAGASGTGGNVVGPVGATDNDIATFNGATGTLIKDSGLTTGTLVASTTHAAPSKATPVDADEIALADSASVFTLAKLTWANTKATLKTYFDTIYAALAGSASQTFSVASATAAAHAARLDQLPYPYRNRIINSDMSVNQVYGGTAITPTASQFVSDQWQCFISQASKLTFQQVVDAPPGLKYSTKITVASQYSPLAGDFFLFTQSMEGQNLIDFKLGTIDAVAIITSQWVKGSVPGTYAVSFLDSAASLFYVGTFVVTTSWQRLVIVVPGATTGTWATDNTISLQVRFDLGSGSNYNATAGSWQAGNLLRTAGSVTFVNQVAGSTLNITGVQAEKGVTGQAAPTEFEFLPYEEQLRRCQRYLSPIGNMIGQCISTTNANMQARSIVPMRATPTLLNPTAWATNGITNSTGGNVAVTGTPSISEYAIDGSCMISMAVSSGLVAGNATYVYNYLAISPQPFLNSQL